MKTAFPWKTFTTYDQLKIRYGIWASAKKPYRGKMLLLSGRSEFMEKYFETIQELNRRGFSVYMFDWRGQGLSDRMLSDRHKGYVRTYNDYLKDLKQFVDEIVNSEEESRMMLLAHSMGGHIALRFFHEYPGIIEKAVLTSPLIDIAGSNWVKKLLNAMVNIAAKAGFQERYAAKRTRDSGSSGKRFNQNRLTHDPGRFRRTKKILQDNPDLAIEGVTFGWLDATFHSIGILSGEGYAEGITLPILIAAAGADQVVSVQAQKAICKRIPHAQIITIPSARHEILMETDSMRHVFWRAFDRFAEQQLST
jgi:lysophospholipase